MSVVWSKQAVYTWQQIAEYILRQFGEKALLDFREETLYQEKLLLAMPRSGQIVATSHTTIEFRYRLIHRLTKMIYHMVGETIYIDTFWDTRMNPEAVIRYLEKID